MINYLKTGWRFVRKNRATSIINIGGLAVGMTVAILIGLWVWDEVSFDHNNKNHERIAQVWQNGIVNGETNSWIVLPMPLSQTLRDEYGSDFSKVVMTSWNEAHVLNVFDKRFVKNGTFMEADGPALFDLQMIKGSMHSVKGPEDVLISSSLSKAFFGDKDPVNQVIQFDNKNNLKVVGVYENTPANSYMADVDYILPWKLKLITNDWLNHLDNPWGMSGFKVFVELNKNSNLAQVSRKIRDVKLNKVHPDERKSQPALFLHPMDKWHLYGDFQNGVNTGGRIQYVWLFSLIGIFVLLLACINFMNLSTARSEKRAKEVGIRKAVGSLRSQLVSQFFRESILIASISALLAVFLVGLALPAFNGLADKNISMPITDPVFWGLMIVFVIITGIIAGSYPAFYLSSFNPVKVLKGTFKAGKLATLPRKILVVAQFTISVILIIGTIVVFRQIQFARNRPLGYNQNGLVQVQQLMPDVFNHFDAVKADLINSGVIVDITAAGAPMDNYWSTNGGISWRGKDPNQSVDFPNTGIVYDYGQTVGWQFVAGRDFNREYGTDTAAFVVNESFAKFAGIKNILGETVKWDDRPFHVIGIIKDMMVESPYNQPRPALYHFDRSSGDFLIFKLNPKKSPNESLAEVEKVFRKYSPNQIFEFKFVDQEYGKKFEAEERIGKLACCFAILAIFISCIGLFGMASFMAEQRIKEIGIRKVLGASVVNVWKLLTWDFAVMVLISLFIAVPLSYYFMHNWLQNYSYRARLSWWIFAAAAFGALLITVLTVSYQSVRAALSNPVRNLRSE
ncbi:MAG: ABC transporter permease [Bacteroidetes bacterium]|nr:MAG: ABC transporter permease [Bacteroidota bacterium]